MGMLYTITIRIRSGRPVLERLEELVAHLVDALTEFVRAPVVGGDGRKDGDVDRAGMNQEGSAPQHVPGVANHDRDDRDAGLHGQGESALLEGSQAVARAPGPFRGDRDRGPRPQLLDRGLEGGPGLSAVGTVDVGDVDDVADEGE